MNENTLRIDYPDGEEIFYRIPNSEDNLGNYYSYDTIRKEVIVKKDINLYRNTFRKRKREKLKGLNKEKNNDVQEQRIDN